MKNNNIKDEEIDLLNLIAKIWKEKNFVIITTFIFFVTGVIYSLSMKNIYEASSTFYPHYQEVENSSIRSLAGLAGVNLNSSNSSQVPTSLYPNLISSTPFKSEVLNQKIKFNKEEMLFRKYLMNKKPSFISLIINNTIKLPIKFISYISRKKNLDLSNIENINYFILTNEEYNLQKSLNGIIGLEVNEKDGFIKLSVTDESPNVAAQIAKKAEEILQKSIINYKLKNIKSVYNFTLKQLEINKKSFYKLQDSLANFKDSNRNIKSDLFLNQLNRIQSEYNVANSLYNELAISKEKTAIEVQKNTPIFTIINPVTLPIEKSYPKRSLLVIIYTFIGAILASLWILIKEPIFDIINLIKNY